MANKYIRHGETYNGDGTTSAAATSNGSVGAWNDINVFEGTAPAYGALAAGDVLNIRSKDAAGADIVRTIAANTTLGGSSATANNWIACIIDDGTIWSGINGTITYTNSAGYLVISRQYNVIKCATKDSLILKNTGTNPGAGGQIAYIQGVLSRAKIDWSSKTGGGECMAAVMAAYSTMEDVTVNWGRIGGTSLDSRGLIKGEDNINTCFTLINPTIILNEATAGLAIIYSGSGTVRPQITVIGGEVKGVGATTGQPLVRVNGPIACNVKMIGLQFPRTMDVNNPNYIGSSSFMAAGGIDIIGCDGGIGGYMEREWGYATSRTDSNPPVLAATIPNSTNSAWSFRVYPKTCSESVPMSLPSTKLFTDTSATKTITLEFLVANTITPTSKNLWMTVDYEDSTGEHKHLSTRDFSAASITVSSAAWSAAVWGAISFDKKKLEITTPTAIKQDTTIIVTLWGTLIPGSANDIYFVDPDFGIN